MSEIKNTKLADAVTLFIEEGNDLQAVRKITDIIKADYKLIHDRDIMMQLAKGCGGKSKMAIHGIARILQSHLRHDNTLRVSTRDILNKLTGMNKLSFYTDKQPAFKYDEGNKELPAQTASIIELIGIAFLQQDQPILKGNLGIKWDEATRISFIQETGIDEDMLYSLASWHLNIASECKNTISSKTAKTIIANVERLNEILEERHGHGTYIPNYLYRTAQIDLPEDRHDIPLPN